MGIRSLEPLLVFFSLCCCVLNVSSTVHIRKNDKYVYPEEKFIKQNLDHFDLTDDRLYSQRYFVSDQYWDQTDGPLFFYCGNEGDIETFLNNSGFIWDIAPMFQAKVIFAEHRYYGKSLPFGDIKPSVDTKKEFSKLTADQALADYAVLLTREINSAKKYRPKQLPVISFGGSYGGMLSAWIRIKYPHIVTGAIASSAPIDYLYDQVNCSKYNEVVTKDFRNVPASGKYCVKNIVNSWRLLQQFDKMPNGMEKLSYLFNTCSVLKNSSQLIEWITDTFGGLAMVNYPYPTTFLADLPAWPLNKTCQEIDEPDLYGYDLIDALFDAVSVFQNSSGKVECFKINQIDSAIDSSLWEYQTCTEFVMPFCTNGVTDMFLAKNWSLQSFTKSCETHYGTTPRPFWANTNFGGRNIKYASNILFLNGELDPWHVGSPLKSVSDKVEVINMWGAAHHLDLRHVHPQNPASVKEAHQKEIALIKQWISE